MTDVTRGTERPDSSLMSHTRYMTCTVSQALQESLQTSNKELEENLVRLERGLEEEKQRGSELDNTVI